MSVLYVLVPVALALAGLGALAFRWAVRNGQYDDVTTPGVRMLFDERDALPPSQRPSSQRPPSPRP